MATKMPLKSGRLVLVAALLIQKYSGANKIGNVGYRDPTGQLDLDLREIQRQNQITKQILQNFLEKSLYGKRFSNTPSLLDILPNRIIRRTSSNNIQELLGNSTQENDSRETLDGDETENVDSYYEDFDFEDCPNCIEDTLPTMNRWTMPLLKLGEKRYYLGIFFKANYFRATQYCRFHGMHLASITSQEENDKLEKYIKDFGFGNEHFWTSGTDLAEEGNFFWMSTGRPITFTNWNAGEPNNFEYENGEQENCLELWNRDGKGLKWNDSPCSFETYFVCEVQP
ncbi:mannose-binding protein C [Dendroctonus ponderosae]|uniref:C-type lectin domain-containing protein n=1 Tax=Dendroctonus ponderosae TaxID=77166 RepID=A0AAR5Q9N8_DENPD|nr:mannose-binding protein C [Dendroctonus ponderosae]